MELDVNLLKLNLLTIPPWKLLSNVINTGEAKQLGAHFSISAQAVKNWTREPNIESNTGTGRRSFLQYIRDLFVYFREQDGDADRCHEIARYVSIHAGGVHVEIPEIDFGSDSAINQHINKILKETSEALEVTRIAWHEESPGEFRPHEKKKAIREHWEAAEAHIKIAKLIERL